MKPETFLATILKKTRARVDAQRCKIDMRDLRSRADRVREQAEDHRFHSALTSGGRVNIIAEIKRASPSKGVISGQIDAAGLARDYLSGGAAAISILTESEYFGGSIEDIAAASKAVSLPLLRKDFIVDEIQIYEAAAAGADAILLIVAGLANNDLRRLISIAEAAGMDALVEVHNRDEIRIAADAGARIIGVNNRDLHSLEVSLDVGRRLINERPTGALMVAESGISTKAEIDELSRLGFDAFLIGEALMRSGDVVRTLRDLVSLPEGV